MVEPETELNETTNNQPEQVEEPSGYREMAILPGDAQVLFPYMVVPLTLRGDAWSHLINDAVTQQRPIAYFLKKDTESEQIEGNLYEVGCSASIARLLRAPDGTVQVLLQGANRVQLREITALDPYPSGWVDELAEEAGEGQEVEALRRSVLDMFHRAVSLSPSLPDELAPAAANIPNAGRLADFIATTLNVDAAEKQDILGTLNIEERLRKISTLLIRELDLLEIGSRIQDQIKQQMDKASREYYLRQQLRAIQQELGETDEQQAEINEYRTRIEEAGIPEDVRKEVERDLDRFSRMQPGAPERSYIENWLDLVTTLPWNKSTEDVLDINEARRILDQDHYDLDKVKERILEYLAVRKLSQNMRGPILSLVGPPGVGKTSLGQSIARAMGRKFVRVSLGGIRDESEIRGHRRTYVGAMPGRIIQGIQRAGSNNPVFMLDEVDKLMAGIQGDPSAALLEVLDPAQNNTFVDLYLNVPFDLSKVLFITTANVLETIPGPLRDRMEVITIPGYTEAEKLQIAKTYLVPKQIKENGLTPEQVTIEDDAVKRIISGYTREAGVRNLDREIARAIRKVAKEVAEGKTEMTVITANGIPDYLGPERFRTSLAEEKDEIGIATGLAWTPVGGDILIIEATVIPGKGKLILTGQLGDVMRESATAALTYARSRAEVLGIPADFHEKCDVHIHVPAGAVPKDGPSAGISMATALISALTKHPVSKDVGMTGEITLRGKVLPIGGLKEKVLAAHAAGLKKIIFPKDNERDLADIPEEVKKDIQFIPVEHMDEVLNAALVPKTVEEKIELSVASNKQ